MKQIILLFSILIFALEGTLAQDSLHTPNSNPPTKKYTVPKTFTSEDYMAKSRKLKTSGWILFGVGTAVGVTGLLVYNNELQQGGTGYSLVPGGILIFAGIVLVGISIPIYLRSGYYKKKALNMTANLELEHYQIGLSMKHFPAMGLSIPL